MKQYETIGNKLYESFPEYKAKFQNENNIKMPTDYKKWN